MTTLQPPASADRDPQRYFTAAQRAEIAARQHHLCARCGADLIDGEWEAHHKIRHEHGGRTKVDNGVGLCRPCHLAAEIIHPEFTPRQWQTRARGAILEPLTAGRFATLNVAPGGGKTLFAGWIARTLLDQDAIDRIVIAVPFVPICDQWYETLSRQFGIYLGVNIASERRRERGVVVTYPGLLNNVEQLTDDTRAARTLWILDEVHHLSVDERGGASAWAYAVEQIVGNVAHPRAPVLNLTGTLFRSKKRERIPTIRYVMPAPGLLETVADFTISAAELIQQGVLRGLRVLGFDQYMTVRGIDLSEDATAGAASMRAVDLDAFSSRDRNRILAAMIRNPDYIDGMVRQTLERLEEASIVLDSTAVCKGLIIGDDQEHAKLIHARLVALGYGAHTYIAISEDKQADENIRRFRNEHKSAILIAVQKVTEGFDVPDVAVLTYLNTWCAPLFVNQMVGRAMRVTKREGELDRRLLATILIPDDAQMRRAFADVLIGAMRMLEAPPEPCQTCGKRECACPLYRRDKQCSGCGFPWYLCDCSCRWCRQKKRACMCPAEMCKRCGHTECVCEPGSHSDVSVEILEIPELTSSNVNGHQIANMLLRQEFAERLRAGGASAMQADLCAAVYEQVRAAKPWSAQEGTDSEDTGQ